VSIRELAELWEKFKPKNWFGPCRYVLKTVLLYLQHQMGDSYGFLCSELNTNPSIFLEKIQDGEDI
jgi:hypothetical protein